MIDGWRLIRRERRDRMRGGEKLSFVGFPDQKRKMLRLGARLWGRCRTGIQETGQRLSFDKGGLFPRRWLADAVRQTVEEEGKESQKKDGESSRSFSQHVPTDTEPNAQGEQEELPEDLPRELWSQGQIECE